MARREPRLVEPGVVSRPRWRPEPAPSGPPAQVDAFGGVGKKPLSTGGHLAMQTDLHEPELARLQTPARPPWRPRASRHDGEPHCPAGPRREVTPGPDWYDQARSG